MSNFRGILLSNGFRESSPEYNKQIKSWKMYGEESTDIG